MDFLDDPAAIYGSRVTISRFTKDEMPNELVNPEISSNDHPKPTYSFTCIHLQSSLADIYLLVPV